MRVDDPTWKNPGCGTHMAVSVGVPAVVSAVVTLVQLVRRR